VALTVPDGLSPDWRAAAVRFVDDRPAPDDGLLQQVSPMGNRGIAYLVRRDGSAWPAGAYRFRVQTASSSVSMDACLVGD
jgi:hypothetical protein